jgi:hypothetical protein
MSPQVPSFSNAQKKRQRAHVSSPGLTTTLNPGAPDVNVRYRPRQTTERVREPWQALGMSPAP